MNRTIQSRPARLLLLLAAIAWILAGTGCSDGVTTTPSPVDDTLQSQMVDIALESDGITDDILGEEMSLSASTAGDAEDDLIVTDTSFNRTRSCPGGGTVEVSANHHREFAPATLTMEATFAGSRSRTDCVFNLDEYTVTVNSSSQLDAFRRRVGGIPDGLQTTSYAGSIHALRSDGEERSCDFSIEVVRDPDTRTRTVTGNLCGDTVSRSVAY